MSWERLGSWHLDFNQGLLPFSDSTIKGRYSSTSVTAALYKCFLFTDWGEKVICVFI